jgi:hypothetical protein
MNELHTDTSRTYPTTYVAYTSFGHTEAFALPPANTCSTSRDSVTLASTEWSRFVFPTASVPPGGIRLPPVLVDYLNGQQEVLSQLGGIALSDCDPQQGGTPVAPPAQTATVTSAERVAGPTRVVKTDIINQASPQNGGPNVSLVFSSEEKVC